MTPERTAVIGIVALLFSWAVVATLEGEPLSEPIQVSVSVDIDAEIMRIKQQNQKR